MFTFSVWTSSSLFISSSNISSIIYFSSENLTLMLFVNVKDWSSPVYVLPAHPPILAFTKGSLFPTVSVDVARLSLILLRVIDLHATFFMLSVSIISPNVYYSFFKIIGFYPLMSPYTGTSATPKRSSKARPLLKAAMIILFYFLSE